VSYIFGSYVCNASPTADIVLLSSSKKVIKMEEHTIVDYFLGNY
jgi:hypothetical protein